MMVDARLPPHPFERGGRAVAEQGIVLLDGPDGVAVSLTPDAAAETGESLLAAAALARKQSAETSN